MFRQQAGLHFFLTVTPRFMSVQFFFQIPLAMTIEFFKRLSTVTMLTCLTEACFVIVQELIVEHTAIHNLAKLIVSI